MEVFGDQACGVETQVESAEWKRWSYTLVSTPSIQNCPINGTCPKGVEIQVWYNQVYGGETQVPKIRAAEWKFRSFQRSGNIGQV